MKSSLKIGLVALSVFIFVGCTDSGIENAKLALDGYIQKKYSKQKLFDVKVINIKVQEKEYMGVSAFFFDYEIQKSARIDFCSRKQSMGRSDWISRPTGNGTCESNMDKFNKKGGISKIIKNQSHIMNDNDIKKYI